MKSKILDAIGISAAGLCLIHCLVFPILFIIPLGISHNPYIDLAFLLIGIVVVFRVTKKLSSIALKTLFWISILLISISVAIDMLYHIHLPLIYIGSC